MKLTILGSGTCASGIPHISDRQPPGYLVEWGHEKLLLDCSEAIRFRLESVGVDYASIPHIAISHSHPDHFALVHFIQSVFCKGIWGGDVFKRDTLSVYCPKHIKDHFQDYWNFHLPELEGASYPWPTIDIKEMTSPSEQTHRIGDATLRAYSVYHGFGRVDALGYRLETPVGTLAYSGDAGMCDALFSLASKADIFLCEASARIGDDKNAYEYGHLNPAQAASIAKEAGVQTLVLTHYTGLDTNDAMIASVREAGFTGELHIASDFDTYNIN